MAASRAAMAAIISDAPVSQLVSPVWHVGLSDRMIEYEPYGSDYYIINADFHEVHKAGDEGDSDKESGAAGLVLNIAVIAMVAATLF